MRYHGLTLQEAVDYVGNLCEETINAFIENKKRIPYWGPEIDDMVQIYVKGLQDWIVGYVFAFVYLVNFLSVHSAGLCIGASRLTGILDRKVRM